MEKINVAIIGCGVIGNALITWLNKYSKNINILKLDPQKNYNDSIEKADAIFISIHIPTENNGTQNLAPLKQIIKTCPNVPIFIRTTLLPGTCDKLSCELNKKIYFMPEFLTERTAIEDFEKQSMIFTGEIELLKKIFIGKNYIQMSNIEAEITKYSHNVFGALKVTYFNGIYEYCKKNNANYDCVKQGILMSGYINETHTNVPGPDGKFGYGGKCFPKDVKAFINILDNNKLQEIITIMDKNNNYYREHLTKD